MLTSLAKHVECSVVFWCLWKRVKVYKNMSIAFLHPAKVLFPTTGCKGTPQEVRYLEHVEIRTSINYTIRGALEVYLESPLGTKVQLLATRKLDTSKKGFFNWTFMSVMTWGEPVEGVWILTLSDSVGPENNYGNIGQTVLILHGTKHLPSHMRYGPRNYNHNYNRVHNGVGPSRSLYNFKPYHGDNDVDNYMFKNDLEESLSGNEPFYQKL